MSFFIAMNLEKVKLLQEIVELARQDNRIGKSQAIAVTQTEWADRGGCFVDFYAVKEIDQDGRISCESIACYHREKSRWIARSRTPVDFWVESFDEESQSYAVSFVHPKDRRGVTPSPTGWVAGFCLNVAGTINVATVDSKKRAFKNKKQKCQPAEV